LRKDRQGKKKLGVPIKGCDERPTPLGSWKKGEGKRKSAPEWEKKGSENRRCHGMGVIADGMSKKAAIY